MSTVYVAGSLAIDRIMDFSGHYKDHILPEKVHAINVSFVVNGVHESFGGTGGNIAYNLALLGIKPMLLSQAGKDFGSYKKWLEGAGVDLTAVAEFESDLTASAYIMTDLADNQIAAFHPGAMQYRSALPENEEFDPETSLAMISPGNLEDMMEYKKLFSEKGIRVIVDPGQQIPALSKEQLTEFLKAPFLAIMNDYEYDAVAKKIGVSTEELRELCRTIIVTKGEGGSTIITKDGSVDVPVVKPRSVIDPTGAGDAFRAGLIKGILQGWDLEASSRLGSVVASYAVEKQGTQVHSFTEKDVEERHDSAFS